MSSPAQSAGRPGEAVFGLPSADAWFAGGKRLDYDPGTNTIGRGDGQLEVFVRHEGDLAHAVTFLPGYPDGSFGWARVLPYLPAVHEMPKLFIEYVGMGDSDKPKDYRYSTAERANLVEAVWRALSVRSTTVVAFDFSSLVVLEHLRRRLERSGATTVPKIRGVFIFNGGLFTDGHTHPWYTTPLLRRLPKRAWDGLGRSFAMFKLTLRVMWSKGYPVGDAEFRELLKVMERRDGVFYLAAAAGFAADHKAQGKRLDFGSLFDAYEGQVPFFVGGSDEDPFEHRQVALTEQRLAGPGIEISHLPGGHLTTSEQPQALARLIAGFERRVGVAPQTAR